MNKKVYLKKGKVLEYAQKRIPGLKAFIAAKKAQIAAAPEGALRTISNKNTVQYYHVTDEGGHNGKYISKKNMELICNLAQKDYDIKVVAAAERQLQLLENFAAEFNSTQIEAVYEKLQDNRKALIVPSHIPNASWISNWNSVEYSGLGFDDNQPEFFTAKGLRVRSKSEILIADALDRLNIPFRYEFPVNLSDFTVHPDFYCLNVNTCEEIVWEHFGMMDDADYSDKAVNKITEYQKKGYFPGKNLIITFETQENPLNSKAIEELILQYLR